MFIDKDDQFVINLAKMKGGQNEMTGQPNERS